MQSALSFRVKHLLDLYGNGAIYYVADKMTALKLFTNCILLTAILGATFFVAKPAFAEDELSIGDEIGVNVCATVFPCHLKTGRLLPGFSAGSECKWERTCENYRKSTSFIKLRKKLQKQKRTNNRKTLEIKSRS